MLIATRAAELIEDGETLVLGAGTITLALAHLLRGRPLQIVTNSFQIAQLFIGSPQADIILVGGFLDSRTEQTLGPYAHDFLSQINVRKAILEVNGITDRGYFVRSVLIVDTARAMMRAAEETILVATSSQFGHTGLANLCALHEVNRLVVDDGIDDEWRRTLTTAKLDVIIAGRTPPSPRLNTGTLKAVALINGIQDAPFVLHKQYVCNAGVTRTRVDSTSVAEEDYDIDIVMRASGIEVTPHWIQGLTWRSDDIESFVPFTLVPVEVGKHRIEIEYFYRRHWLALLCIDVQVQSDAFSPSGAQ